MGSESVPSLRGNRPAETLRAMFDAHVRVIGPSCERERDLLDAALRAERLAVVEEIRERLNLLIMGMGWENVAAREVKAILDEVGVAARSAQSDSAGLTEERTDA